MPEWVCSVSFSFSSGLIVVVQNILFLSHDLFMRMGLLALLCYLVLIFMSLETYKPEKSLFAPEIDIFLL